MATIAQIENNDSAVKRLANASNALERGEFIDCDPALQAPADIPFDHPLVREFTDAWKAVHRSPERDVADKNLLSALEAVQHELPLALQAHRVLAERRKTDAFQGGVRRLLDAFLRWSELYGAQFIIRHRMACITEERARQRRAMLKIGNKSAHNVRVPKRREKRVYVT
jgi:hypothetical protein